MKTHQDVLEYQERLVKNYKYRPLPTLQQEEARKLYRENLPEGLCMDGAVVPLFSNAGLKIATGYNRIVIGDYGAMVEILPEQMVHENIQLKPGQEYRELNPKYSGNVKFAWLTAKDESDVKIYLQKKEVAYAELVPGRYYVGVFECVPAKMLEQDKSADGSCAVSREAIDCWLKDSGVYTEDMSEYYVGLVRGYGYVIACAIQHEVPPYELEFWMHICDVCQEPKGLSYEQLQAISYNLQVIGCMGKEFKGTLSTLAPDVRTAVKLGIEELPIPFELQQFEPEMIRALLKMPFDSLMAVSRFSKVVAGHKAENLEHSRDVDAVIADANKRVSEAKARFARYEHEMA